ncbi:MAG: sortase [Candidatus Pacebacteria bacterium]|nr:sortase [Candidatus Paceibacterota bacterium]
MKIWKFGKYFFLIFFISFSVINWENISWVFNYRTVSTLFSDFLKKDTLEIQELFYEEKDSIEINKIDIKAPLIIGEGLNNLQVYQALDNGVVLYPSSALPGEIGQSIVLGHSSPPGWPKVKYDWVFTNINELNTGNKIIIYFNNKKFTYTVKDKIFLERGEQIPEKIDNNKSVLVLISCWPPGKDLRRIAVISSLDT